tara:strand:- start:603 stop:1262 length:660 start_codon:yes stop_codon:yes gene_type:complete
MQKIIISASLLSADFTNLDNEISKVMNGGSDRLHIDIMDGHFVDNLAIGIPEIKCIRKKYPDLYLDCHLMVTEPDKWINLLINIGVNSITYHIETVSSKESNLNIINKIKNKNIRVGIAIKPETNLSEDDILMDLIPELNLVLIMTVNPGFGGQKFMIETLSKVSLIREKYKDTEIQVDGGLNNDTAKLAIEAGANNIVSGSFIFGSDNINKSIQSLRL